MALTAEGIDIPSGGDYYSYVEEQRKMSASQRTIVPSATRVTADAVVTGMAADGRPVSDTNPVYVHNRESKGTEFKATAGIWRPLVPTPILGHMGKTDGFQAITTLAKNTFSAAQVLKGGVTFDNTNDCLVVPISGLYRVNCQHYTSGGGNGTQVAVVYVNAAQSGVSARYYKQDTFDAVASGSGLIQLAANDQVSISSEHAGSNVSSWGTNGYNGTYLEVEYVCE